MIAKADLLVLAIMILGLILATALFQSRLAGFSSLVVSHQAKQFENQKPKLVSEPKIQLIELKVPDCNLCLSFDTFKEKLSSLDINIKKVAIPYNSKEAKGFIKKGNVKLVGLEILLLAARI